MKLLFILILCALTVVKAASQICPQEEIVLANQAQVDSFSILYPGCTQIDVDMIISGVDIYNLDSLQYLDTIRGNVRILNTPLLTSLHGLHHLKFVDYFYLNNTSVTDLNALSALRRIFSLSLENNINLTSLDSLHHLKWSDGIVIYGNPRLKTLRGLHNITDVMGLLWIDYNDSLQTLQGLNSLRHHWGMFSITGNANLESLEGLEELMYVKDILQVGSNPKLQNFHGLQRLTEVVHLFVSSNTRLYDFDGLQNLETIRGSVYITNNDSLTTLHGLESVKKSHPLSLNIYDNPQLTSLWGVKNLELNRFDIFSMDIYNNPSLNDCDIPGVCERILEDFTSPFHFANNALGCSSIDEIRSDCLTASGHVSIPDVQVLGNPVSDLLRLQTDFNFEYYQIYSISGHQIRPRHGLTEKEIDVSALNAGMYLICLTSQGRSAIVRFTKV